MCDGSNLCNYVSHIRKWFVKRGLLINKMGGGPRVVVSTAAFHARVPGSVPGLGGFKETKMFLPHPRVKVSIVGSLRDREVACSASDRQVSNFESCVWRTVSSHSSHHPQEVLLAQFSLYVHKGGLKPDSFHLINKIIKKILLFSFCLPWLDSYFCMICRYPPPLRICSCTPTPDHGSQCKSVQSMVWWRCKSLRLQ